MWVERCFGSVTKCDWYLFSSTIFQLYRQTVARLQSGKTNEWSCIVWFAWTFEVSFFFFPSLALCRTQIGFSNMNKLDFKGFLSLFEAAALNLTVGLGFSLLCSVSSPLVCLSSVLQIIPLPRKRLLQYLQKAQWLRTEGSRQILPVWMEDSRPFWDKVVLRWRTLEHCYSRKQDETS